MYMPVKNKSGRPKICNGNEIVTCSQINTRIEMPRIAHGIKMVHGIKRAGAGMGDWFWTERMFDSK